MQLPSSPRVHTSVLRIGNNSQRLSNIVLVSILSFHSEMILEINKCLVFSGVPSLETDVTLAEKLSSQGDGVPLASHIS